MKDLKTICKGMDEKLAGLLLDPASTPAEVHEHVEKCESCRKELEELKATMNAMDAWEAPEPTPFFFTQLNARMREERQARPLGWLGARIARLRASFVYGPSTHMRPLAAMALTVVLLLGGGAYLSVSNLMAPAPVQNNDAAVVHDLQTLDNNAQVLDTLEALSTPNDDSE